MSAGSAAVAAAASGSAAGEFELTRSSGGQLSAKGRLTFATASIAREAALELFAVDPTQKAEVDLSGITASDSAGLAVLLDWLAMARQSGGSLHYTNLPSQVQALARIIDVLELLERGV